MPLIKLGTSGFPEDLEDGSIEEKLDKLSSLGFESFEFQFLRGIDLDNSDIEEFKQFSDSFTFSAHAPFIINLAASKEERIDESIKWILKSSEIIDKLGEGLVVFHPGYYAENKEETSRRIRKNLEKAINKVESSALNVKLGLESTAQKKQFGSWEEIFEVCRYFGSNVRPVLDFAHIHARTSGSLKGKKDFRKILERMPKNYEDFHFHIACVEYKDGEEISHQSLNSKEPDYKPFIDILKSEEMDFNLIMESPTPIDDARKLRSWLHE